MPAKSRDRRIATMLSRRKGNSILQTQESTCITKPVRKPSKSLRDNYSTCVNCFGLIKNSYLWRHRKICKWSIAVPTNNGTKVNNISESQTFLATTGLLGNFLKKCRVLEVFKIMRGDDIVLE